jgi:hypothetical protein
LIENIDRAVDWTFDRGRQQRLRRARNDDGGYGRRIYRMKGFHQLHEKNKLQETPTSNISHKKAITMANLSSRLRGVRGGYTTEPSYGYSW